MSNSAAFSAGPGPAPRYVDDVIRAAVILTMFWAIVAFLVGVVIAAQLAWPQLNLDSEHLTFGRLRPVHTSAAIFAFGGSALFGTSFYVVQRTCRARLFGGEALGELRVLGLPVLHRHGGAVYRDGLQPEPGIRRTGMAHRPVADGRLGGLR